MVNTDIFRVQSHWEKVTRMTQHSLFEKKSGFEHVVVMQESSIRTSAKIG